MTTEHDESHGRMTELATDVAFLTNLRKDERLPADKKLLVEEKLKETLKKEELYIKK